MLTYLGWWCFGSSSWDFFPSSSQVKHCTWTLPKHLLVLPRTWSTETRTLIRIHLAASSPSCLLSTSLSALWAIAAVCWGAAQQGHSAEPRKVCSEMCHICLAPLIQKKNLVGEKCHGSINADLISLTFLFLWTMNVRKLKMTSWNRWKLFMCLNI